MLVIIPARGGSKGLPGKNIRSLNGKPLIGYSIEAAMNAKYVDRVVVSTDDEEIADACRKFDVDIPFMRPPELATDDAKIIDTYLYTVDRLNNEFDCNYDSVISLLPTCPLRTSADIDAAIEVFQSNKADSVISFYEAPHPVQWYHYIDDDGVLRPVMGDNNELKNRQNQKKTYLPNGAIYIFKVDLLRQGKYYSDRTFPYLMPSERSVDIDTSFDFKLAEFLSGQGPVAQPMNVEPRL